MRIAVACIVVALAGCANTSDGRGAIVLVSGRDDHGLVLQADVPLYPQPEATVSTGKIRDGRLARVLEVRGSWLRVESLDDGSVTGWIDDFFLRDRALLDGREQVRLLDARSSDGRLEVKVEPLVASAPSATWAPASDLAEVLSPAQ